MYVLYMHTMRLRSEQGSRSKDTLLVMTWCKKSTTFPPLELPMSFYLILVNGMGPALDCMPQIIEEVMKSVDV